MSGKIGRIWGLQGFDHDFPEDFEGDDFDFNIFPGAGQVDGAELAAEVGGLAFRADGVEVCLGHLDHHFDHAVAPEGVVAPQVAVGVLVEGVGSVDDGIVVFALEEEGDVHEEDGDVDAAFVLAEDGGCIEELSKFKFRDFFLEFFCITC